MTTMCAMDRETQERLTIEFERLKKLFDLPDSLTFIWHPDGKPTLSGEVKGDRVYIYDADPSDAVQTLRHEIVDLTVSQAINPYKDLTNLLIRKLNDDAYRQKEKVVDALLRIIDFEQRSA